MAVGFVSSERDSPNSPEASEASSKQNVTSCLFVDVKPPQLIHQQRAKIITRVAAFGKAIDQFDFKMDQHHTGAYRPPARRGPSGAWNRLKPVTIDPLDVYGLPSKGDNR